MQRRSVDVTFKSDAHRIWKDPREAPFSRSYDKMISTGSDVECGPEPYLSTLNLVLRIGPPPKWLIRRFTQFKGRTTPNYEKRQSIPVYFPL
jgi:hypothetical protein